jgi:glycosyltransferase involved in cell wall biosynthesis
MKVLMVHNRYGTFSGEEYAVETIARLLESKGHRVSMFLKSSADLSGSIRSRLQAGFSGIYSLSARAEMARRLNECRFDIVQLQNLFPLLSPSILGPIKQAGIPIVMRCPNYRLFCPIGLHMHRGTTCEHCLGFGKELWCVLKNCGQSVPKSLAYAIRNAAARLSGVFRKHVTLFVVASQFQKQRFIDSGIEEDRIEVIHNTDLTVNGDLPQAGRSGSMVSFIGRLSEEKGIHEVVEVARMLPAYPFSVAGDTSRTNGWVANAPPNVRFFGFISGDELAQFYQQTRILVYPSLCYEGFPNVLVRAMAAGKAIICSRIGGLPEVVEDGVTGLLVEPGNRKELAAGIEYLWNNPKICQKMGQNARNKALSRYSPDRFYERLMACYHKAIDLQHNEASRRFRY